MILSQNSSLQGIPEPRPKRKFWLSILLGLFAFIVAPAIALITAVPFFLLGKISESFNPLVIIAGVFGLQELGGFFAAQFILIAVFALAGDLGTAIISWFVNHSK